MEKSWCQTDFITDLNVTEYKNRDNGSDPVYNHKIYMEDYLPSGVLISCKQRSI